MNANTSVSQPAWRESYPFASNYFNVGPHRLHYVDQGQGSPLLFVHGNPTWSFYYRDLINQFRNSHRAIAVDHLGCGLSDKPQSFDYCLQDHIDNLVELIKKLDLQNATLVAHDWGGAIGLGALLQQQSRFKRIVLFNTAAFPPPYIPFRIRVCRWPLIGPVLVRGLNGFAKAAVYMATEQRGGLQRNVAAGFLAPYDSWSNRVAINGFVKDIPLSPNHKTWQTLNDIESALPQLDSTMSIDLIWGMKDWCFRPECLDRFIGYWPSASVHRAEQAGHFVVEDATAEIIERMSNFLID